MTSSCVQIAKVSSLDWWSPTTQGVKLGKKGLIYLVPNIVKNCNFHEYAKFVNKWKSTVYTWLISSYSPSKLGIFYSSVASPICQEGQSERTFPISTFSSRFFLFFLSLIFSLFLVNFMLSGVALCPPWPPVAMPLIFYHNHLVLLTENHLKKMLLKEQFNLSPIFCQTKGSNIFFALIM